MNHREQVNRYGTAALQSVVNDEPRHVAIASLMYLETSQLEDLVLACVSLGGIAAQLVNERAILGEGN